MPSIRDELPVGSLAIPVEIVPHSAWRLCQRSASPAAGLVDGLLRVIPGRRPCGWRQRFLPPPPSTSPTPRLVNRLAAVHHDRQWPYAEASSRGVSAGESAARSGLPLLLRPLKAYLELVISMQLLRRRWQATDHSPCSKPLRHATISARRDRREIDEPRGGTDRKEDDGQ